MKDSSNIAYFVRTIFPQTFQKLVNFRDDVGLPGEEVLNEDFEVIELKGICG